MQSGTKQFQTFLFQKTLLSLVITPTVLYFVLLTPFVKRHVII